jgi:KDO2-lipid IV(A) lauroyltransferase
LTFLADQYAGIKGCWVDFFGRPASVHKSIALLALENNARLSVCASRRLGRPMRFELYDYAEIDPRAVGTVRELTQWYTSRLEELIRQSPEQYWWLHRRWKDPRPARRAEKAAA